MPSLSDVWMDHTCLFLTCFHPLWGIRRPLLFYCSGWYAKHGPQPAPLDLPKHSLRRHILAPPPGLLTQKLCGGLSSLCSNRWCWVHWRSRSSSMHLGGKTEPGFARRKESSFFSSLLCINGSSSSHNPCPCSQVLLGTRLLFILSLHHHATSWKTF